MPNLDDVPLEIMPPPDERVPGVDYYGVQVRNSIVRGEFMRAADLRDRVADLEQLPALFAAMGERMDRLVRNQEAFEDRVKKFVRAVNARLGDALRALMAAGVEVPAAEKPEPSESPSTAEPPPEESDPAPPADPLAAGWASMFGKKVTE
jgi:hypothetical protein